MTTRHLASLVLIGATLATSFACRSTNPEGSSESDDDDDDDDSDDDDDDDSNSSQTDDDDDNTPSGDDDDDETSGDDDDDSNSSQTDDDDDDDDDTPNDDDDDGTSGDDDDDDDDSTSSTSSDSDTSTGDPGECQWKRDFTFADKVEPSSMPPGGLAPANVPMFISLGWDDNGFVDGFEWALDYYKTKRNPKGNGNPCTFDDLPARATFYITSQYELKDQWRRAYDEKHEMGNHTTSHDMTLQQNSDKMVWLNELNQCNSYLTDTVGVPHAEIYGFRTPFLAHSEQTYAAIQEIGFLYDCSIEHYKELTTDAFVWPYTLDNGRHANSTFNTTPNGKYPGLWELPVYQILTDEGGTSAVTGFDYNMWAQSKMTKQQAVDAFKATLAQRMASNRAPLLIGMHTDYYSADNTDANTASTGATYSERREAVEDFLNFALSEYPEVRIVRYIDVIRWMREPVGLDGTRGQSPSVTPLIRALP